MDSGGLGLLGLVLAYVVAALSAHWWPFDSPTSPGPISIPKNGAIADYKGVRILKSTSNRTAFVVQSGVAQSIPNGGTYICNAHYYPVEFSPETSLEPTDESNRPAECPAGRRAALGPSTLATGYLLIERDVTALGEPVGRIWLLEDGRLVSVPGRGPPATTSNLFICLSRIYLAWDFVSSTEIERFARSRAKTAQCPSG
jgi:hypothetical protein